MENNWNIVVSSLQDIFKTNEVSQFDEDLYIKRLNFDNLSQEVLQNHINELQKHTENIQKAQNLIAIAKENLDKVISIVEKDAIKQTPGIPVTLSGNGNNKETETEVDFIKGEHENTGLAAGKVYWNSQFTLLDEIYVGSNVAYKPKKSTDNEWFQCEVIKVFADGMKFEVRDPEPDELGNTGKLFKCTWKDIILIPSETTSRSQLSNYPINTRVLARYPETTTFYPAVVMGNKRDGTCRLKFDGEEDFDKETEVPRRFVLPLPNISAKPLKK